MKTGSSLKNFILVVISVTIVLFTYVAMVTEIKNINRIKIIKQDSLKVKLNSIELKTVEIQKQTSAEIIVRFAQDSLGLIRPNENLESITVSRDHIKQIEKLLNEKYD